MAETRRDQSLDSPTLTEQRGRCWEALGAEDLQLDASVDGLEADGEMQLRVTHLEEDEITLSQRRLPHDLNSQWTSLKVRRVWKGHQLLEV